MDFKISSLAKIEIFSPGTAGERAIRVEKKDGEVIIIDEKDAESIVISGPPKNHACFSIVKTGEAYDAYLDIFYTSNGEEHERHFIYESVDQALDAAITYLKMRDLPYPGKEELEIEEEYPDYYSVAWDSEDENLNYVWRNWTTN